MLLRYNQLTGTDKSFPFSSSHPWLSTSLLSIKDQYGTLKKVNTRKSYKTWCSKGDKWKGFNSCPVKEKQLLGSSAELFARPFIPECSRALEFAVCHFSLAPLLFFMEGFLLPVKELTCTPSVRFSLLMGRTIWLNENRVLNWLSYQ